MNKYTRLALAIALTCSTQAAHSLTINFDYSYDTSGFFDTQRMNILQSAGNQISSRVNDNLTAITSDSSNQFNAIIPSPDGSGQTTINNTSISADTLTIYVGAQNHSGNTLATAGPGGFSFSGFSFDPDRGQATTTGPGATDFAPWGGSISFDADSNWYFDDNTATTEAFVGNDFYSVALHELGHVFGIGTSDSWANQISGNLFTGTASSALFGEDIALNNGGHFADNVSYNGQQAAMTASILSGTRKEFTELDFAALSDIGWEIRPVPLPAAVYLFGTGLLALVGFSRRKKVNH